jgi:long-chain acyl-CoA synthetase
MPEAAPPSVSAIPASWWRHDPTLLRVVTDLLAAELALARPGRPPAAPPWPRMAHFGHDFAADSLELLGMATALAEALHLGAADADTRLLAHPVLDGWVAAARAGLDAGGGQAVTFRTSGSAGTPKRCTHALATLWQEVGVLAGLLPGRRRILSAVPSHHIYGFLFTVLLPRALGIDTVIDLRGAGPAASLAMLRPGDLVVAHPGWWEALARLQPGVEPDVAGVSSTAPCPDALADELAAAGLRLVQVYGSSETAGVGWREASGAPFSLFPYWRGVDGMPELIRQLPDGGEARYPLQDALAWTGGTRFRPAGRIDQAVQVGGTNVFPGYVADVLRMHPAVLDAAVRLMRADEGRRLKAFVVPRAGHDADPGGLREALSAWIGERLATPERPAAWTFGERLPRQASGKPADWIIECE